MVVAATSLSICASSLAPDCASGDHAGRPKLLRAAELEVAVEQSALQRQYRALLGMSLDAVEYSARGTIESVVGDTGIVLPADAPFRTLGGPASDLLPLFKDLLLARGTETLTVKENSAWYGQERTLSLGQSIRGIPVIDGVLSLSYNARTMHVTGIATHFVPDLDLPRKPKVSSQQAKDVLRKEGLAYFRGGMHLAYFAEFARSSAPQLVWAVEVGSAYGGLQFLVDAESGSIVSCRPLAPHSNCPILRSTAAAAKRRGATISCGS